MAARAAGAEGRDGDMARHRARHAATDRHVGRRIRQRRVQLGLSLEQLAQRVAVTAQQARKYEVGRNGVPAGRLAALAGALGVGVGWFFDGLAVEDYALELPRRPRMLMDIVRNFDLLPEDGPCEALCEAARALAASAAQGPRGGG
jgi:transcriptional regulator with XRE-family HTH domain